ncbi:hypothetical protein [Streptococcus oricebi]|uniref:ABC transporter permease n=1 Tax=Streptococcus oricebi TaxID=1547447 RepID=A0ABS5B441_9STRE|nr:hypothetical protein [Streptococcus oricebi]MBP2623596.1 ABC transporter permease [Streptococcus oricebi]
MSNYLKSEWYRIFHTKTIYILGTSLASLAFLTNLLLSLAAKPGFPYATLSYSLSNLVASPMLFVLAGALISLLFYENAKKSKSIKNSIAFGIRREDIFLGQCLITTLVSSLVMLITLAVYLTSAYFLLAHTGPVTVQHLVTEVPATFFIAVASVISMTYCLYIFDRMIMALGAWFLFWNIIPQAIYSISLGFKLPWLHRLAMYLPANFFSSGNMPVNMSQSSPIWATWPGMLKCLVVGIIATILFSLVGISTVRKKDI